MIPSSGDDLLAELEDSLPQGVPNSVQFEADDEDDSTLLKPVDDFMDLEDLLDSAMKEQHERERYQLDMKARKRSFSGMTPEEVAFCNSRMAAFEAARIWRTELNVAVFATVTCLNCGDTRRIFSRWMIKQQSRVTATTKRLMPAPKPTANVKTIAAEEPRNSAICPSCAMLEGIDTHGAVKLSEVLK